MTETQVPGPCNHMPTGHTPAYRTVNNLPIHECLIKNVSSSKMQQGSENHDILRDEFDRHAVSVKVVKTLEGEIIKA